MNLLRPPVLRAGSLDAARVPSRMGERLVQPPAVDLGTVAPSPAVLPAPPTPMPTPKGTPSPDHRASALREARRLARQHHITPAELAGPAERAAAIAEARELIAAHGITERDLFGR